MKTIVLALCLLCAGFTGVFGDEALTIVEEGMSVAEIVVAKDAPKPEQHAAKELARFIREISGANLRIITYKAGNRPRILVGKRAAKLADPGFTGEGLGREGIVIRTVGDDLILAGGSPRGTLYAVYTFLEETLGCRWWTSDVSYIPKKQTIKLKELDIRYIPPLEYRESFWQDGFDADWAVRNKSNGYSTRIDEKRGGKHLYAGWVHTFYSLIPPERYFKDHPEWFSEIKGERSTNRAQLCLTNEEMRKELVKNLKELLRKNPGATIASVSQNDWQGYCECGPCAALDTKEYSHAGTLIHFINKVSEEIEDEFPDVAISTLAYQYTRKPPKYVKPRNNVIVRLCSIECSFSKPLSDERNKKFRNDIIGWSKVCDRLYIWDYTTNFSHHFMPHPNLRVLGPNVKFFADHSVKGIFEQGAYTTIHAEMADVRAWVLAKLLWNPQLDGDKLVKEFVKGYYGRAGKYILKHLDNIHDRVEKTGDWLGCFSSPNAKFLSEKTINRSWSYLRKAEKRVKDDPDLLLRVRIAQIPLMYTSVVKEFGTPETRLGYIDSLYRIAKELDIPRLNEWGYPPEEFRDRYTEQISREMGATIHPGGMYATDLRGVVVSLSTSTKDVELYVTTDGSEPTEASGVYAKPFTIAGPTTVRARMFRDGEEIGTVIEANFEEVSLPFETKTMRRSDEAAFVRVSVRGAKRLRLIANDAGDSNTYDHADWADPKLITKKGKEVPLTNLEIASETQGWGELRIDKSIADRTFRIGKREFKRGLGAHANSEIVYELDGKYEYFESWIGVDMGGNEKSSIRFKVEVE